MLMINSLINAELQGIVLSFELSTTLYETASLESNALRINHVTRLKAVPYDCSKNKNSKEKANKATQLLQ